MKRIEDLRAVSQTSSGSCDEMLLLTWEGLLLIGGV